METVGELDEYKDDDDDFSAHNPTISELYSWRELGKNEISSNLIYVTFQDKEYRPRTLEEAMLATLLSKNVYDTIQRSTWKEIRSKHKLKFSIPKNKEGEQDSLFSIREIVKSSESRKTDFMYSVILNTKSEEMLPTYIKEGLDWLMKKD